MWHGSSHTRATGPLLRSVFLIKLAFIPIRPEQQAGDPRRGSSHLLTDHVAVHVRTAFDNQLIMDMADDKTVGEGSHAVAENVSADGLDQVLNDFRAVTFDAGPVFCAVVPHVGDALTAELILSDPGLHVR